jgi:hypothetical protein
MHVGLYLPEASRRVKQLTVAIPAISYLGAHPAIDVVPISSQYTA